MNHKLTLQLSSPGEREVAMTRVFSAPRPLVFKAWTEPELVKRWLTGPDGWELAVCEIDFQVGGRIRYVWKQGDAVLMGMTGRYLEIVPADKLVHTELFDQDWTGGETQVTTTFTEAGGQTTVQMVILYPSIAVRDMVLKSGMEVGMDFSLNRLEKLLESLAG